MTAIFWTADTNIDRAYRWPSRWPKSRQPLGIGGALLDILPLIRGVFRG